MPIALLTGGTGFVGGHVARALSGEGWSVRLLARDRRRVDGDLLRGLALDVVEGDLADESRLAEAARGVGAIVHVAGLTKARTLADYRRVNVEGTSRLLEAGHASAPDANFVLVSSQSAAGPALAGRAVRDEDPARPISWYGLSKREAEEAVAGTWTGPWTVIRPVVVYGPGDRGLLTYFRMAASGWLPVPAAKTRIQLVGAGRAALAIARAATRPAPSGRTRFLTDPEPVTLETLARSIAQGSGRRARILRVPDGAVRLLGRIETVRESLTRTSRPFNADKAREILAGDWLCDGARLDAELSLPAPASLGKGLAAAWDWYRRAGWLPGGPGAGL